MRRKPRPPAADTLLGFRLPLLASIWSATSARRYERLFGLKNREGRAVFVLGSQAQVSLNEFVRQSGIEKAYASRTVAALVERGLVEKAIDPLDRRAVRLALTQAGSAIYQAILGDAVTRERDWVAVLTAEERQVLLSCLDRLDTQARLPGR
jgi:DNA-binding MarR family transcriptional regulator